MKPIMFTKAPSREKGLARSASVARAREILQPPPENSHEAMLRTRSLSIGVNLVNPSNPHLLFQQDTITEKFIRRGATPSKMQIVERSSSIRLEKELAKRWHPDNLKKPKRGFETLNPNEMKISTLVVKLEENKKNLERKFSSLIRPEFKDLAQSLGNLRPPNKVAYAKSFHHEATKVFNKIYDKEKAGNNQILTTLTEPALDEPPKELEKQKTFESKLMGGRMTSRAEQKIIDAQEKAKKLEEARKEQLRAIARHQAMIEGNKTLMKMRQLQEFVFGDGF